MFKEIYKDYTIPLGLYPFVMLEALQGHQQVFWDPGFAIIWTEVGIRDFKAKWKWDSGCKACVARRMLKFTIKQMSIYFWSVKILLEYRLIIVKYYIFSLLTVKDVTLRLLYVELYDY